VFRSVLSVIVGVVTGVTIIDLLMALGHKMYPAPATATAADLPLGAFVMCLVAWWFGTSTGAGVSAYLASMNRRNHGWIAAGLLAIYGLVQLFRMPHPGWFVVAALVVFPLSAFLGMLIGLQPVPGKREGYVVEGPPPDYSAEAEQRMKMMSR
jgi:hypothetical protein